ncbi:energy transducer TonB [Lysobacter psychrotolerans]|uniref:Protein TonB n=1 Tax=Montanilutibacter psychrotolerans TaxID=1327343 RepID=A0A3M8ST24_9GAMM|nr:energy transducer TonB [Lysobacter psychrotolerans]
MLFLSVSMAAMSVACTQPSSETAADAASPPPRVRDVAEGTRLAAVDPHGLRQRAERALHGQRIHSPVGDNAIEHYLALRDRQPDAPGVAAALVELQPYAVIASEQAIAAGDLAQAHRLLGLLQRVDAQAPALPRLAATLAQVEQAAAEHARRVTDAVALSQRTADDAAARALLAGATRVQAPRQPLARDQPVAAARAAGHAPSRGAPPSALQSSTDEAHAAALEAARLADRAAVAPPGRVAPPPPRYGNAAPRLLVDAAPRYPAQAIRRRLEGSVLVAFTIGPDGSVSGARVLDGSGGGVFDAAALAAAARWRFERGGARVDSTRRVQFRLPSG